MKRLSINLRDVADAIDSGFDISHYLDCETGEVKIWGDPMISGRENDFDPDEESERYVEIPTRDAREGFREMEEFASGMTNEKARSLVTFALNGPKPFRRFKDALLQFPDEREKWFAFHNANLLEEAREWLDSLEIEYTEAPSPGEAPEDG